MQTPQVAHRCVAGEGGQYFACSADRLYSIHTIDIFTEVREMDFENQVDMPGLACSDKTYTNKAFP